MPLPHSPEMGVGRKAYKEGEIIKCHKETFGGDGYVHYLDCEDGVT